MKAVIICLIITFTLCSCNKKPLPAKEEPLSTGLIEGLPPSVSIINGYFFTSCVINNKMYQRWFAFASFSDPGKNLIAGFNHYKNNFYDLNSLSGNVSAGDVSLDTVQLPVLSDKQHIVYKKNTYAFLDSMYVPHWRTTGNGSFLPVDVGVPSIPPRVSSAQITEIYRSKPIQIDLTKGFRNYDSVRVQFLLGDRMFINKGATASGPAVITISENELKTIDEPGIYINYFGFKYFHQWLNGNLYVYEISTLKTANVFVYP